LKISRDLCEQGQLKPSPISFNQSGAKRIVQPVSSFGQSGNNIDRYDMCDATSLICDYSV